MEKYTTKNFDRDFPDDDACLDWLFQARWPDGVTCPKCERVTRHARIKVRPCYSCVWCGSHVYPMAGTIFEGTRFNHLKLWFKAVAYMAVTRCGISSRQLSRDIGVGVKTGYRMFQQIRKVLAEGNTVPFAGKVEIDETFVGGKDMFRHAVKRTGVPGRGSQGKTAVLGIVERGGRARGIVVPNVKAATIIPEIEATVLKDATIYTDELWSYSRLRGLGYSHKTVEHGKGIYVIAKDIHVNTIEGFWSQLKRSINGTYHHVTARRLQRYVDEYAFRYSHRKDEQPMFKTMMRRILDAAI